MGLHREALFFRVLLRFDLRIDLGIWMWIDLRTCLGIDLGVRLRIWLVSGAVMGLLSARGSSV
jgi:hypothetical protein